MGKYVVFVIAILIGYLIVNAVIKKMQGSKPNYWAGKNGDQTKRSSDFKYSGGNQRRESWGGQHTKRDDENLDEKYLKVLELNGNVLPAQIKRQYHLMLTKYHPDKVSHLGVEFQRIAERKTKEIMEAYSYFKIKYKLE